MHRRHDKLRGEKMIFTTDLVTDFPSTMLVLLAMDFRTTETIRKFLNQPWVNHRHWINPNLETTYTKHKNKNSVFNFMNYNKNSITSNSSMQGTDTATLPNIKTESIARFLWKKMTIMRPIKKKNKDTHFSMIEIRNWSLMSRKIKNTISHFQFSHLTVLNHRLKNYSFYES